MRRLLLPIMKRLLLLVAVLISIGNLSAQTKTAYCDVYARGGGKHLKITIMYDGNKFYDYMLAPYNTRSNIGDVLNMLAEDGWELHETVVIPRHPFFSLFTRHKLHLIMKKEYQPGENPFLLFENSANKNSGYGNVASSPSNLSVCEVEYNGVKAIKVKTSNDKVILVAVNKANGTWPEAVKYCKSLGDGWRLPSTEEFRLIKNKLTDNAYWTCEELNEKRALYYGWLYDQSFSTNKSSNYCIQPIAIVRAEDLK